MGPWSVHTMETILLSILKSQRQFTPRTEAAFLWVRPWHKTGFIILEVETLGHVLMHQKSRLCMVFLQFLQLFLKVV